MVFHVLHNSLSLAWPRLDTQMVKDWPVLESLLRVRADGEIEFFWPVIVASACVMAAILYGFHRVPNLKTRGDRRRERASPTRATRDSPRRHGGHGEEEG
jgi:hypothetical protein